MFLIINNPSTLELSILVRIKFRKWPVKMQIIKKQRLPLLTITRGAVVTDTAMLLAVTVTAVLPSCEYWWIMLPINSNGNLLTLANWPNTAQLQDSEWSWNGHLVEAISTQRHPGPLPQLRSTSRTWYNNKR